MSTRAKGIKMKGSTSTISRDDWGSFLDSFSRRHHGWLVQLDTHDRVTDEKVVSRELPLQSIKLDLEDEKHPRINVTVRFGNKVIKHILFLPSELVLQSSDGEPEQSLQVETVNTETTIRLRAPEPFVR